jgi:histidinol dehydrogenase
VPVDRVGLYVPGGLAVYPEQRGHERRSRADRRVGSLAVASPPQRENVGHLAGYPHPTILAACALLGSTRCMRWAAPRPSRCFAYGFDETTADDTCEPVSLVTGPGNIYVAAAKRLSRASSASTPRPDPPRSPSSPTPAPMPSHVAADLISQAEHDPLAASVLVTDSVGLADARRSTAWPVGSAATKHSERVIEPWPARQSAIVLVDDLDAGLAVVNAYAAEHLEIQTATPQPSPPACATPVRSSSALVAGQPR